MPAFYAFVGVAIIGLAIALRRIFDKEKLTHEAVFSGGDHENTVRMGTQWQ